MSPAQNVLTLLTVGAVAWQLDAKLAALSLAVAPMLAAISVIFGQPLKRRAKSQREVQTRLLTFVHQTLQAVPVVQAFASERRNRLRFRSLADDAVTVSQQGALLTGAYGLLIGFVTTADAATVLYVGGGSVLSGSLSLGTLLVFLAYMRTMQGAAESLLQAYGTLKPMEASIDRVLEILESQDQVREMPGARLLEARSSGRVRLEDVTFGYEPGCPVLKGVSLEARPGETIALVGSTGAGKTTLVSMIPRFFDPWMGRVTLDGMDIRRIQIPSLRAQVALLLQEPFLLPLTAAENIAFGRPDATSGEIMTAAKAANADAFIRRLPEGYDTRIGEQGATLSGGERQQLAIARALLKDSPILILDEPTSALDAATEAEVLDAVERLMAGRTTLIVAHRLSTIRRADRIVVIEAGTIVEAGTHSELLASGGLYHRFYSLQFQGSQSEVLA